MHERKLGAKGWGEGLAKLWGLGVRLGGRRSVGWWRRRRHSVRIWAMEWWHKVVFPMRRAWTVVSTRVRSRKNGGGLLKLHDDVQTCGYQDVQVMWEMLRRSETTEPPSHGTKRKGGPFSRLFVRSNGSRCSLNGAQ